MVDSITFREDDNARWGGGQGSDLTASQIDINFWVLLTAVQALQAQSNINSPIDHLVITGTSLYVHLANHFVLGPYTLPVAQWNFRGPWAPVTAYAAFDVVTADHAVYLVLKTHSSKTGEFDPDAADTDANPYYGLLLEAPPSELPIDDGVKGQVLQWQNSPDDVRWFTMTRNIAGYFEGVLDAAETCMEYVFTERTVFAAGLTNSQFSVGTRPTGDQQFTLFRSGGSIGSVTIHHTGAATIVFTADVTFTAGEVFSVIGPTIPDAHMTRTRLNFVGQILE